MTNEEAIKILNDTPIEIMRHSKTTVYEYFEMMNLAEKALDLRILKIPVYSFKESGERLVDYERHEVYKCPTCGNIIYVQNHSEIKDGLGVTTERYTQGKKTKCCDACGQALNWRNIEKWTER